MRREHLDFMAQLKGIARNLNRLTKLTHAAGFDAAAGAHASIIDGIEDFLNRLSRDR